MSYIHRVRKGFSLLELLIVLTVTSLLLFIAVSSNRDKLAKTAVLQAQLDLLTMAAKMEEFKLANYSYIGAAGDKSNRKAIGIPWIFSDYSPSTGAAENSRYNLLILSASDDGYELVAEPREEYLSLLGYSSKGERYWDKNSDGVFSADEMCWKC